MGSSVLALYPDMVLDSWEWRVVKVVLWQMWRTKFGSEDSTARSAKLLYVIQDEGERHVSP